MNASALFFAPIIIGTLIFMWKRSTKHAREALNVYHMVHAAPNTGTISVGVVLFAAFAVLAFVIESLYTVPYTVQARWIFALLCIGTWWTSIFRTGVFWVGMLVLWYVSAGQHYGAPTDSRAVILALMATTTSWLLSELSSRSTHPYKHTSAPLLSAAVHAVMLASVAWSVEHMAMVYVSLLLAGTGFAFSSIKTLSRFVREPFVEGHWVAIAAILVTLTPLTGGRIWFAVVPAATISLFAALLTRISVGLTNIERAPHPIRPHFYVPPASIVILLSAYLAFASWSFVRLNAGVALTVYFLSCTLMAINWVPFQIRCNRYDTRTRHGSWARVASAQR